MSVVDPFDLGYQFIDSLHAALDGQREVVIFDFPRHTNCGDNAIWLGEEHALNRLGVHILHRSSVSSFKPEWLSDTKEDVTVLLHGGGNVSGVWPLHTQFRERVTALARGRRVIQLPQSVDPSAATHLERLNDLANSVESFVFMVRDRQSERLLEPFSNLTPVLVPDAAFAIPAEFMPSSREPAVDVLWLGRTDAERATDINLDCVSSLAGRYRVIQRDWVSPKVRDRYAFLTLENLLGIAVKRYVMGSSPLMSRSIPNVAMQQLMPRFAAVETKRGLQMLGAASVVVTDRLHGHVLCTILGKEHIILDSGISKLSSLYETWTSGFPFVQRAGTCEEVTGHLERLLGSGPAR